MIKRSVYRWIIVGFVLAQAILAGCQPAQPVPTQEQPTVVSATHTSEATAVMAQPTHTASAPLQITAAPTQTPLLPELPFDQFVDQAFAQLMRRDPEWATAEGVADLVGADETLLTDLSVEGVRQTHELQRSLLEQLRAYPRAMLGAQQRLTYDAFEWYLDDLVRGQEFSESDFPINQLQVLSVNYLTEYLFSDQHTIVDEEDARAYLARLSQVGKKLDDVLAGLERREQAGVIPPRRVIEASLGDIQIMANSAPNQTLYYITLYQRLALLSSIPPEVQKELLQEAEDEIEASVLPAYQRLAQFLEGQRKRAPLEVGLWQYPRGEEYYQYLLRHHTTTDLTPDQVHQLGLDELARLQAEMRRHFDRLGYPPSASINDLYVRVANEGGTIAADMVLQTYEEMISQAENRLDEAFSLRPAAKLEVRGMPEGIAFYTAAPLDGSRPGIFYAPVAGDMLRFAMPTLAYHEAVPGHHFQISLARELNLPLFRNLVVFGAYAEGWAMYTEHLAGELNWYADDPYGDLGRLQSEAFRAARLVVDTGVHAKRWTFDQAVNFLVENTGMPYQHMAWEVTRYVAWPGQATSYEVGLLKLLELRQNAQQRLGERFDLKDFHTAVLQTGSLPLSALESALEDYMTLASLERANPGGDRIPFYTLRYAGDYGLQAYLQHKMVVRNIADPLFLQNAPGWACTTFTARTPQSERLLARNFDWYSHPALILFTTPTDGYASASMVDISYLGFDGLIDLSESLDALLRAPYYPFDGMNERGLGVGMMAVPHGEGGADPNKRTLDSLEIIRVILDYAASVDEALAIFEQYNLDWGGGPPVHYLVADANGDSAVVELIGGKLVISRRSNPWQISTNFLFAETPVERWGQTCHRYAAAQTALTESRGTLTGEGAMNLLEQVSQPGETATIWSVVYNLTSGAILASVGRDYQNLYTFILSEQE